MFKGTPETVMQRREEIINACELLYQTMSFRDINLKEISKVTSFSRPTIYNYFQTKEEIFLALYEREYDRWNEDLESILNGKAAQGEEKGKAAQGEEKAKAAQGKGANNAKAHVAEQIARSLEKREQLLKLLAMNNFDMEENSREELLVSFKKSYGKSLELFRGILETHCPDISKSEVEHITYVFFPFMFGIYPYAKVTDKQRDAMKDAEVNYHYQSIYEITYNCLIRLLQNETTK